MGKSLFMYVVDRDYGFAPNPFHGYCSLATCKPKIRNPANIGDWVIGMGGGRLKATGRCIFAMEVTEKLTYDTYWAAAEHQIKKPVRNGSQIMMVGDNIYHCPNDTNEWIQADCHHSLSDGSPNQLNINNDTKSEYVLLSDNFYYFGSKAPVVPPEIIGALEFKNKIGHRRFTIDRAAGILEWVESSFRGNRNRVIGDPFDFDQSHERYSPER